MKILLSCIDLFFYFILLIYAKFPFIWNVTLYRLILKVFIFCNGDSKNENFDVLQKYGVRPIKWKRILCRLTMWSQKIGQYNSVESSLKMDLIFSHIEDYSKSARRMILFWLGTCYHTPKLYKNSEKPSDMWFFTQILFESTVHRYSFRVSLFPSFSFCHVMVVSSLLILSQCILASLSVS